MTVQQELERLKKQKEGLEKERSLIQNRLDEGLLPQEKTLQKKGEELSKRTSPLAQTLQAKNQKELEEIHQSIKRERKYLAGVEQELQDTQAGIDARENDTALYIQEQVRLMVSQLLEWIARNKETIGYDIKRSFHVAGLTEWKMNQTLCVYTGDVGIFEKGQATSKEPIICSMNFYFNQRLTDNSNSDIAKKTDWYAQYEKDFIEALLAELEESYNLTEDLKLTIKSPEFTLELV